MNSIDVTPLHIERGRQIRSIVQFDIVNRSLTFDQSVDSLSEYLGLERETILLSISIVEEFERGGSLVKVS